MKNGGACGMQLSEGKREIQSRVPYQDVEVTRGDSWKVWQWWCVTARNVTLLSMRRQHSNTTNEACLWRVMSLGMVTRVCVEGRGSREQSWVPNQEVVGNEAKYHKVRRDSLVDRAKRRSLLEGKTLGRNSPIHEMEVKMTARENLCRELCYSR